MKDWIIRAGKTFWQAGGAVLLAAIPSIFGLIPEGWQAVWGALYPAIVATIAAGLSAVWNALIAPELESLSNIEPPEEPPEEEPEEEQEEQEEQEDDVK